MPPPHGRNNFLTIIERGEHGKLVKQNGVYRELYETQFSKALEKQ